jgi:tetratricopeptide (TPR) repeat protein
MGYDLAELGVEANLASAYLRIAEGAARNGDYALSERFLSSAAEMDLDAFGQRDSLGISIFQVGLAAFNNGDFEVALTYYDRAIDIVPDDQRHVVYNNIGFTYFNLENYEAAIENYNTALSIQPDYVRAITNLGNAQAAIGDHDSAAATFQRALDIEPQNEAARLGMEQLP